MPVQTGRVWGLFFWFGSSGRDYAASLRSRQGQVTGPIVTGVGTDLFGAVADTQELAPKANAVALALYEGVDCHVRDCWLAIRTGQRPNCDRAPLRWWAGAESPENGSSPGCRRSPSRVETQAR
jgi:hypothetical protein